MAIQNDLRVALSLLTRLPLKLPQSAYARSAEAAWAYPFVGIVTGAIAGVVALIALGLGLGPVIAAVLTIAAGIIVTGAMHEDGLADCADGLWGGWDREMRLKIMKDSQIGTYGVLALGIGGALRVLGYATLFASGIAGLSLVGLVVAVHVASRAVMPIVMATLPHARTDGLSQSVGRVSMDAAWKAGATGLVAVLIGAGMGAMIWGAILIAAVLFAGRAIAQAKIGGQTGDVIGAHQQLAEIALLLMLVSHL